MQLPFPWGSNNVSSIWWQHRYMVNTCSREDSRERMKAFSWEDADSFSAISNASKFRARVSSPSTGSVVAVAKACKMRERYR